MAVGRSGGMIRITIDPRQLEDIEQTLANVKNGTKRAITVAINRTGTSGTSRIIRRLGKILNLKVGSASKPEPGTIASFVRFGKATFDRLVGTIKLTRKGMPLMLFKPRQTKAGVVVKTRKDKRPELLRGTFLATMKSGHTDVFERRSRFRDKGSKHRVLREKGGKRYLSELPIDIRYGPTPLGLFENVPGLAQEEFANIETDLQKNLASQVDRLLERRKIDRPE